MPGSSEKVVHKIEPRGSEFLEEVSEGSTLKPNPDAPPEAFSAGMIRELADEPSLRERGLGPTDPLGRIDLEDLDKEEPELEAESPEEDSPPEGGGGKDEPSTDKGRSETIPRARFDEVNSKAKEFEASHNMLQWILENPEKFAATIRGTKEEASPPPTEQEFMVEEPRLPEGKTLDDLNEKEIFEYVARQTLAKVANESLGGKLGGLFKELSGLKDFRNSMEDLMMKAATGPDGKALFPRWEELRPQVKQVMSSHPTLDKREAYVLAERMASTGVGYSPPVEKPAGEPPTDVNKNVPPQPPVGRKVATPEAVRAAQLTHLGRSSGAYGGNAKPQNVAAAVRMAMRDSGYYVEES